MSEHWKSTPKYWCKHCACYVRDTKLERQNHEATGRHQGALKRFLRDLHRGHDREEREKERARQEVARLNGVVSGPSTSSAPTGSFQRGGQQYGQSMAGSAESQARKQREQLAAMGVAVPTEVKSDMAMPGEWTVTSTRVIETSPQDEEDSETKVEAKATGVRKREETQEQKDEEEAIRGLFKKPKRWGRDSKAAPDTQDDGLDALLSGSLAPRTMADGDKTVKKESDGDGTETGIKKEKQAEGEEDKAVKEEPSDALQGLDVKGEAGEPDQPLKAEDADEDPMPTPVVFKKRKPKGIRQK